MARHLVMAGLAISLLAACGETIGTGNDGLGGSGGGGSGGSGGGSAGSGGAATGPTWHQDVQPIVARACEGCHSPGAIAPFALRTYAEARPWHAAMRLAVESGTMPPWLASDACNQYLHDPSLDEAEIATFVAWSEAGAPEGEPKTPVPPTPTTGLERVDVELPMPEAYTPRQEPDDYRCFLLDWPRDEVSFITGFQAVPGAPTEVHHVIAFLIEPDLVDDAEALDAAEEGPGWTCFSGPGVGSGASSFRWLGAWAPGSNDGDFPAGMGLRIEPGSKIALQAHYNTLTAGATPDQTTLHFKVEESVEREGIVVPFTNPGWMGSQLMSIPAGESDVRHAFTMNLSNYVAFGLGGPSGPLLVHAAALHMHQLGTSASMRIARDENACVLDIARWDFHWQAVFSLEEPLRVESNESLELVCNWDNTPENQIVVGGERLPARDVAWGEGTRDEMCLGILYVTAAD